MAGLESGDRGRRFGDPKARVNIFNDLDEYLSGQKNTEQKKKKSKQASKQANKQTGGSDILKGTTENILFGQVYLIKKNHKKLTYTSVK